VTTAVANRKQQSTPETAAQRPAAAFSAKGKSPFTQRLSQTGNNNPRPKRRHSGRLRRFPPLLPHPGIQQNFHPL